MRPLTIVRALAWIGVALAGWSINLRWGADAGLGGGPPGQWERHVVGAALLCAVSALTLSVAGSGGARPGLLARGVATAAAAGAAAIALFLRVDAQSSDFGHLVEGPGWSWLAAGVGVALGAAIASHLLRARPAPAARRRAR